MTVGWQLKGTVMMSESSLGRRAPNGVPREELDRRKIRDERGAGQALVGRLLKACLDLGVEPRVSCRGTRLVTESGRVTGVRIEGPDGTFEARAAGGVVLATGGFKHDEALTRAFLRGPLERAVSVPTNTGDGLRMAMRVGADLTTMREAWWVATIDVDVPGHVRVPGQVNTERSRPHTIMVNDDGVRFTNEAANYNALGNAFHVVDVARFAYVNHPAWMIVDHDFLTNYGLAGHRPSQSTADWLIEAASLRELAERIDVPADTLEATVQRWNTTVAAGSIPTSRGARVTTTGPGAILRSAALARGRSARSTRRRTTRCACGAPRSGRRAARAPTRRVGSSTWTVTSSTASTPPATRWVR